MVLKASRQKQSMSETEPEPPVAGLLPALRKLPTYSGLVFRGLPQGVDPPLRTVATSGLTPTSTNPAVALEGRSHGRVVAILSRNGRVLGRLSAHPELAEVVFLPGTLLSPVQTWTSTTGVVVALLEELAAESSNQRASSADEMIAEVERLLQRIEPFPVLIVGKFAGGIF